MNEVKGAPETQICKDCQGTMYLSDIACPPFGFICLDYVCPKCGNKLTIMIGHDCTKYNWRKE